MCFDTVYLYSLKNYQILVKTVYTYSLKFFFAAATVHEQYHAALFMNSAATTSAPSTLFSQPTSSINTPPITSHNSYTPPLSSSSPKFKRERKRRLFIFCRKISVSCQLQAWIWRFSTHFLSTISSSKLFAFLFSSLSCICMLDLMKSWPRYCHLFATGPVSV